MPTKTIKINYESAQKKCKRCKEYCNLECDFSYAPGFRNVKLSICKSCDRKRVLKHR